MQDWNLNVQRMIDYVERNLRGDITVAGVARRLGYSPWWCTRQFSRVCGKSLRSYVRMRRLSEAAIALRDSRRGILDVAVEFGFSSQEAFTRAFVDAWGTSPGAWRKSGKPIPLTTQAHPWSPFEHEGGTIMAMAIPGEISRTLQTAPARRFLGIWVANATDYLDFWGILAARGVDCAVVEGTLASLTAIMQVGGWQRRGGVPGYLYGVEVEPDYAGAVPEGMELIDVPETTYAVFRHPPYDFDTEDAAVWGALKEAVESFSPGAGYAIDGSGITFQRHDPANMGQSWCVPLVKA